MTPEEANAIWREYDGKTERDRQSLCTVAEAFTQQAQQLVFTPLGNAATPEAIARAKYQLQELYFRRRGAVTPRHFTGMSSTHHCLLDAYHVAYERLAELELRLVPTLLPTPRTSKRSAKRVEPGPVTAETVAQEILNYTLLGETEA